MYAFVMLAFFKSLALSKTFFDVISWFVKKKKK